MFSTIMSHGGALRSGHQELQAQGPVHSSLKSPVLLLHYLAVHCSELCCTTWLLSLEPVAARPAAADCSQDQSCRLGHCHCRTHWRLDRTVESRGSVSRNCSLGTVERFTNGFGEGQPEANTFSGLTLTSSK